jgi:hypothetical protein
MTLPHLISVYFRSFFLRVIFEWKYRVVLCIVKDIGFRWFLSLLIDVRLWVPAVGLSETSSIFVVIMPSFPPLTYTQLYRHHLDLFRGLISWIDQAWSLTYHEMLKLRIPHFCNMLAVAGQFHALQSTGTWLERIKRGSFPVSFQFSHGPDIW